MFRVPAHPDERTIMRRLPLAIMVLSAVPAFAQSGPPLPPPDAQAVVDYYTAKTRMAEDEAARWSGIAASLQHQLADAQAMIKHLQPQPAEPSK